MDSEEYACPLTHAHEPHVRFVRWKWGVFECPCPGIRSTAQILDDCEATLRTMRAELEEVLRG